MWPSIFAMYSIILGIAFNICCAVIVFLPFVSSSFAYLLFSICSDLIPRLLTPLENSLIISRLSTIPPASYKTLYASYRCESVKSNSSILSETIFLYVWSPSKSAGPYLCSSCSGSSWSCSWTFCSSSLSLLRLTSFYYINCKSRPVSFEWIDYSFSPICFEDGCCF